MILGLFKKESQINANENTTFNVVEDSFANVDEFAMAA